MNHWGDSSSRLTNASSWKIHPNPSLSIISIERFPWVSRESKTQANGSSRALRRSDFVLLPTTPFSRRCTKTSRGLFFPSRDIFPTGRGEAASGTSAWLELPVEGYFGFFPLLAANNNQQSEGTSSAWPGEIKNWSDLNNVYVAVSGELRRISGFQERLCLLLGYNASLSASRLALLWRCCLTIEGWRKRLLLSGLSWAANLNNWL